MSLDLNTLIQKFESKKEFREVKIKTRQSFREDQEALDKRLSKYRKRGAKMSSVDTDGRTNGQVDNQNINGHTSEDNDNGVDGVNSRLESIVIDIKEETVDSRSRNNSEGGVCTDTTIRGARDRIPDTNVLIETDGRSDVVTQNGQINNGYMDSMTDVRLTASNDHGNDRTPPSSHHDGHSTGSQSSLTSQNQMTTNGHKDQNGYTANGYSALVMRPKSNGHIRAAMTPEPRPKLTTGIYQKNPKLTGSTSDHLDNISLKGGRSGYVCMYTEIVGQHIH